MDITADNATKLKAFATKRTLDPSYLAGFIDGDGCIYIRKEKATKEGTNDYFQAGVEISQSRTNILQIIALHYGGKIYAYKRAKTYRTEFTLRLAGNTANILLNDIREHLVIKHKQAELVLEINKLNNKHNLFTEKDKLHKECASLNLNKTAKLEIERINNAYIAGLFDAEGYCSIRKNTKTNRTRGIRIKITQMSYPQILFAIHNKIKFGKVVEESEDNIYWATENFAEACQLFILVIPYIVVKFNQVEILTKYIDSKKDNFIYRNGLLEQLHTEKHQSETLPTDFNLDYTIYEKKVKAIKAEQKKIKKLIHLRKVKKQYAEKSEQMMGEKNHNYGKERSLEHSYKISASRRKDPYTFEEYKEKLDERKNEEEIKSKLSAKEIEQRGIQKNSKAKRKATAKEVIHILQLVCNGNTETTIIKLLQEKNKDTLVTVDTVKNVKAMKTQVYSIEPEYDEYIKMKNYYIDNRDQNTEKKLKAKANKNALGRRKISAKMIIDILQMYKENMTRKSIVTKMQEIYSDSNITENTIKNVRSTKTKVLEIEPEYSEYTDLLKHFS